MLTTTANELSKFYLRIVENPYGYKLYDDLASAYRKLGLIESAEAVEHLIRENFQDERHISTNFDVQRRIDDTQSD